MAAGASLALLPKAGTRAWFLALGFLFLSPLFYGLLALYLGQDANWDLRNYHWYNAYAFWTGRLTQDVLPAQTPTFYNPTLDVPFYLLATHASARVTFFVLAVAQGLNAVLIFFLAQATLLIGNPLRKVGLSAGLALMGVLGAGALAQVGATFYDNITSLGIFASALIVVLHLETFQKASGSKLAFWAFMAGLPAGLMMGFKLPSVVFCVGLNAALLFLALPWQRRLGVAFLFGCGVLAGLGVSLGHWAFYLYHRFGNPFFPYFNNVFQSPFAPISSARDTQFLPGTWEDKLFFPYIFTAHPMRVGEIPWRDARIATLYSLMPFAAMAHFFYGKKRRQSPLAWGEAAQFLLLFAAFSYLVWLVMFAIYRYAVPLEMLVPLLIVISMGLFPLRRKTRFVWAGVILVLLMITMQPGNWGRRAEWMEHVTELTAPPLEDPAHLMILMAGYEPYSHVVSSFPPEVAFVRIQSNFTQIGPTTAMETLIRDRLAAHKDAGGRFMILLPTWQHKSVFELLQIYGLRLEPSTCHDVDDKLYDKLDLCDVVPSLKKVLPVSKKKKGWLR